MAVDDISDDFIEKYDEVPLSFHLIPSYSPDNKYWKHKDMSIGYPQGIFVTAYKYKDTIGYCYDLRPELSAYPYNFYVDIQINGCKFIFV